MEQKMNLSWSPLLPLNAGNLSGVENSAGVFRISKKNADGKFYVIFVGSSPELKTEIEGILLGNKGSSFLMLYIAQGGDFSFRYALLEDENIRKAIERQMYKHYAPICNQSEPESDLDIKVNLN